MYIFPIQRLSQIDLIASSWNEKQF